MSIAQRLYEAGKITYMRTDSLNLSQEAIQGATAEIASAYGSDFVQTRTFKTKSQSAQEAHEAIRPTNFANHQGGSDYNEQRLYDLIWKRAIASQMADAQLEKTTATIGISTTAEKLRAQGEVIKFEGFLKVYIESTDDEEGDQEAKGMLPPLSIGQSLGFESNDSQGRIQPTVCSIYGSEPCKEIGRTRHWQTVNLRPNDLHHSEKRLRWRKSIVKELNENIRSCDSKTM